MSDIRFIIHKKGLRMKKILILIMLLSGCAIKNEGEVGKKIEETSVNTDNVADTISQTRKDENAFVKKLVDNEIRLMEKSSDEENRENLRNALFIIDCASKNQGCWNVGGFMACVGKRKEQSDLMRQYMKNLEMRFYTEYGFGKSEQAQIHAAAKAILVVYLDCLQQFGVNNKL